MTPRPQPAAIDVFHGQSVSFTTEIMVGTFIVFFFLSVLFVVHFLRKNRYLGANPVLESSQPRFVLTSSPLPAVDPNILKSLPVTIVSSVDFKDSIECAVCLSVLGDGEAARMLPGCRHGFHLECIDMWFGSNSTCPLCRSSVDSKNLILEELELSSAINEKALRQGMVSMDKSGEGSSSSMSSGLMNPAGIMKSDVESFSLR